MSSTTINDLTDDLLDCVSRFVDTSAVKNLRATCKNGNDSRFSSLISYQDERFVAAAKIQRFWHTKKVPDDTDNYWGDIPWSRVPRDHIINTQYKRLLISKYPLEHVESMTRNILQFSHMEIDEERIGTISYFTSLVRSSTIEVLNSVGW
jgi:hypothetical protein